MAEGCLYKERLGACNKREGGERTAVCVCVVCGRVCHERRTMPSDGELCYALCVETPVFLEEDIRQQMQDEMKGACPEYQVREGNRVSESE